MSEERKTKTDAAAPASAALERIDRKDAFLQALHTFLTAHQGTEWAVAAVDIQHFKLYNELYGTEKGDVLLDGKLSAGLQQADRLSCGLFWK